MAQRIFDEKTLRKLEQLTLIANKVRAGAIQGERRSSRRGNSIEFADYRNYVRGDDLRRVDWNIYARFERPFIKLLENEEDLAVHLLLDGSASMDWPRSGQRDLHKFLYGQRVMAGLAYMALGSGDHVSATIFRQDGTVQWGPLRGRGHTMNLLLWLEKAYTRGHMDTNQAMQDYARRAPRAGLCIVITDLMSPEGYEDGLRALQGRGHEVTLIQILSPDEVAPEIAGDLQLIDVETGVPQEVTLDAEMRAIYMQRVEAWQAEISEYCTRRGIHYVSVQTSTPWEQLILTELRRLQVVH
ncbi:MAG: DUF58 domain-containing protein [Chloroflexi bacterium]|nr:DUF58 domain-containing protein [Chloroflexota bacterium]